MQGYIELTRRWFHLGLNPWINGIRLAVLNGILAASCVIGFLGSLYAVILLAEWARGITRDPAFLIPFPFPLLLLLYGLMFVVAWFLFARRLPVRARRHGFQTAVVGAIPLFGLALLGYANVAWMIAFGDFNANSMLGASVWVYGIISTLVSLAGVTCVAFITALVRPQP